MHDIIFDEDVVGFLNKLPRNIKERIYNKIVSTKENPFRYFERLEGRKDYRFRVGDYRVIAEIDSKKIQITLAGHRRNVYKK